MYISPPELQLAKIVREQILVNYHSHHLVPIQIGQALVGINPININEKLIINIF